MASSSFSTLLSMHDGSNYNTIAEVMDISGPALQQAIAAVTNQQSANRYSESISTLKGGEISFDINYLPSDSTHDPTDGILSAYDSGNAELFRITFPNSYVWSFSAIVLSFDPVENIDGHLVSSINMMLTGSMTFNIISGGFPYVFPYILS